MGEKTVNDKLAADDGGKAAEIDKKTVVTGVEEAQKREEAVQEEIAVEEASTGCCSGCCRGCREDVVAFRDECVKLKKQAMEIDCRGWCRDTFSKENLKKKLPITQWLPKYNLNWLQGDIIAGLTVGLTVIPQGIAYAVIADLPPQYGLYSAFIGCFVYCFFGTSKDIQLGPTAIMSFMTAIFAAYEIPNATDDQQAAVIKSVNPLICVVMTLFCGLAQLFMGIFHIGLIVEYIAHPLINSFTNAAAITIACSQVKKLLGLKNIPREFIEQFIETIKHIPHTNLWDAVMGAVCIILLVSMKKMKQKFQPRSSSTVVIVFTKIVFLLSTARNAIVVILATGVAFGVCQHRNSINDTFSLTGHIKPGLPPFKPPSFSFNVSVEDVGFVSMQAADIFKHIGAGLIIVPILSLVETIAIGKAFARKNKYNIEANQELIAIGIANILGSFVSAYPVTGSFSRTAVNSQSGVRTPSGGVWTGAMVLLALAFLTRLFFYIPDAALAAVIITAVLDMLDFSLILKMWRTYKPDLVPWLVCFILSFALGIEYGILIGVGINLLMLLYPWSRPKVTVTEQFEDSSGQIQMINNSKIVVVRLNLGLRFSGMEYLRQKLVDCAELRGKEPKHAVLNCERVSTIDYSTIHGFHEILEEFGVANMSLVLCNVDADFHDKLVAEGVHTPVYNTVYDAVDSLARRDDDLTVAVVGDRVTASAPPDEGQNSPDETTPLNPEERTSYTQKDHEA